MSANLYLDANFVKAEVAKLISENPELAEDDVLRADAIEGETDAYKIVEKALDEQRNSEEMASAIKSREADMEARRFRFERRAEAMRQLIKSILKAAKLPKMTLPEATVILTPPKMSVGIDSVEDLPQGFFKTERKADKAAIKAAFAAGEDVPGAFRVLGPEGLQVRTK